MARPKKVQELVRLEVHYEHVRDRRVWPAITILAAMLRDDVGEAESTPVEAAAAPAGQPAGQPIPDGALLAYSTESPA